MTKSVYWVSQMKALTATVLLLTVTIAIPVHGGKYVKMCRDADGKPYFSDVGCPDTTKSVREFYAPNAQSYHREWNSGDVQMLDRYEQQFRPNLAPPQSPEPALSFEQAHQRALEATGYRDYERLTGLQKDRVNVEMAKHPHLPPPPPEPSTVRRTTAPPPQLLINGVPAVNAGGGNYIDPRTGHFLQGAAGGVIDTVTNRFMPTHP